MRRRRYAYMTLAEGGINVVPLIDILFFLIHFFTVATTVKLAEHMISVSLPPTKSGETAREMPRKPVEIAIEKSGTISLDGNPVSVDALPATLKAATGGDTTRQVIIRGDQESGLGQAVKVLDICRLAGHTSVQIRTLKATGS